jgi:hypothetical protein
LEELRQISREKIRELLAAHLARGIQPPEALVQAIEQE